MTRKNNGRRLLALAATLCLLLSLCVSASAARFTDLSRTHWAYDEIMDVVDKGLFKGTGNDTFGPEVDMTRAMFVTVLSRLAKADVDDTDRSDFDDVPRNTWYTGAVIWAADNGIVKGVSKDEFAPDRVITREEMATMIVRYTDFWGIELPKTEKKVTFADWQKTSDFADDAVDACQRAGLLKGVGDNKFDPKGTATRSQVATLISRLSELDGTVVYTVSFVTNGATKDVKDQNVVSGQKAEKPTGVRRNGYTLVNWYTDKNLKNVYNFKDPVESDLTLYAKWRRSATGGSSVSYPSPEQPDQATLGAYLAGQPAFKDIPLTYPKMTMDGNTIVLEGAFTGRTNIPGFGATYPEGYVVPLKLYAPSNYTSGEIRLETTSDTVNVNKVVEKDGDYFIYVLKFIPANATSWDPTLSVTWNGNKLSYTFDVTGMEQAVSADKAMVEAPNATQVGGSYPGVDLTFADVQATVVEGKTDTYLLHLSGGYAVGSLPDSAGKGYVVPLRFIAPDGYEGANLSITSGTNNDQVSDIALTGGAFTYPIYIPAEPGAAWAPVIQVTWIDKDPVPVLLRKLENKVFTYTLDLRGMRPVRGADPVVPDAAAMREATALPSNAPFQGIEDFTAQAKFSAPSWNAGKTQATITMDVTYTPFLNGTVVPGFGTVGETSGMATNTYILPMAFQVPDYLNLDALTNGTDIAMTYQIYWDGAGDKGVEHKKDKDSILAEDPFLIWKHIPGDRHGTAFHVELTWFGGYTEHYLFKPGEVKATQNTVTVKDMVSGSATIADATKDGPFAGLDKVAAQVTLTKGGDGVFTANADYTYLNEGQNVPGFGTAGTDDVPVTACILPFAFPSPDGLDLSRIGSGDTAMTLVFTNAAGAKTSYTFTKSELLAEDPMHFYYIAKDPTELAGKAELKFELTWYGGTAQTFTVKLGELKGAQAALVGKDMVSGNATIAGATKDGPFKGLDKVAAKVTLTKDEGGVFTANADYTSLYKGQNVPGFGTAGTDDVPSTSCILPFAFPTPTGLNMAALGDDAPVLTILFTNADKIAKTYTVTKADLKEDPFHFYYIAKDPEALAGKAELAFKLTWCDSLVQNFTVKLGALTAKTTTPDGKQFSLTVEEKNAITNGAEPFKGIQFNNVGIIAATVDGQTVLKLSTDDPAQSADNIRKYYGQTYGEGFIVGLKFPAPVGAAKVEQTILKGYTQTPQTKLVEMGADTAHTLLLYVPKSAPNGYAPVIQLTWKNGDTVVKTETFKLDLTGMHITIAPTPTPTPVETPKEEKEPSVRDLFRDMFQG